MLRLLRASARGLSYGRVFRGASDRVDWGRKVKETSDDMVHFLGWAVGNFARKGGGQFARVSGPRVSSGKVLPSSRSYSGLNRRPPNA
eukprot:7734715-Pyramimonas_sp.AAC.1